MLHEDADTIESDIEWRRDELARTMQGLQSRTAPDVVARRVLESGGEEAALVAEDVVRRARANPVAVGLIAVGIAWLALGARGEEPRRRRHR